MSLAARLRSLIRGHGPHAGVLAAAEDAGLRITPDGPERVLCGSSAHRGDPTPAEIHGRKTGVALIAASSGGSGTSPWAAYCLRCAALAYLGEAFMPDAVFMAEVQAEAVRLIHQPFFRESR